MTHCGIEPNGHNVRLWVSTNAVKMFGPDDNPTAENLLSVIGTLQEETGVHLKIRAVTEAA